MSTLANVVLVIGSILLGIPSAYNIWRQYRIDQMTNRINAEPIPSYYKLNEFKRQSFLVLRNLLILMVLGIILIVVTLLFM